MEKPDASSSSLATTRRQTLKIIASAASTAGFPILMDAAPQSVSHPAHRGAQEATAAPYVLKYFSQPQAQTLEALSETIIPADDHSPGAKAAKVYQYIDEIVSAASAASKKLWIDGLSMVDGMATDHFGKPYAKCTAEQQFAILEKMGQNEEQPVAAEEKFFVTLKATTIDGYYTSKIGIHQDLEYQGNTVVLDFPGCTHDEHKAGSTGGGATNV
jgi:hypothetical protein